MRITKTELRRILNEVRLRENVTAAISSSESDPDVQAVLNTPQGQKAVRRGEKVASSILRQDVNSLKTVGDLKKALMASLATRDSKRTRSMIVNTAVGIGSLLMFPLMGFLGSKVAAAGLVGLGSAMGTHTGGMVGTALAGLVGNVISQKYAVTGTPLEDFAVDQRILDVLNDQQEHEFIEYMATVIDRVDPNTKLKDFDMNKELEQFLLSKYGIKLQDAVSKEPAQRMAAGYSRERRGTGSLVEKRVREINTRTKHRMIIERNLKRRR